VGEQSSSFFDTIVPAGWTRYWQLNLNYPDATTSQDSLLQSSIAAIHAAGNSVGYASFLIGGNDIFYLLSTPAFQAASDAEKQVLLGQTIQAALNRYGTVLTEVKTLSPEARILLPGYYNPYPSGTSEHALFDSILAGFNPSLKQLAELFGATYIDLYSPFVGNELVLTNIASGDFHPTQAGYEVIAQQFTSAVVPEPASLALLLIGAGGALIAKRLRPIAAEAS
jgi:lysophospholipase L1-like esterase